MRTQLDAYYAALGARDSSDVQSVVTILEATEFRLSTLDADMLAEVDRFEAAALDIADRLNTPDQHASNVFADADDALIELELYRDGWDSVLDPRARDRLEHANLVLRNVVDASPHPLSTPSPSHQPQPPVVRPEPKNTARRLKCTVPERELSCESGDDAPMRMVIARNRTLRDMAESAMALERDHLSPSVQAPSEPPSPGLSQPDLKSVKHASFASTLYHTRNARVDTISDCGVMLFRSNVRGDGRCLFRALARGRWAARGQSSPSERAERDEADKLRSRAVAELKKHRQLLARFFVIEGDFGHYTRKMSNPHAYGGEPELLMLAKLLHLPIAVYIQNDGVYRQIQVYGKQYQGNPLRILYSDGVHYDALLTDSQRNI